MDQVTVLVPNRKLSDEEREKIALESNFHDGSFDLEKLATFNLELLNDIHFDTTELNTYLDLGLEIKEDEFDPEKELNKITEPKTKLGNVIELGRNRLICGDSTQHEVLNKLFGDEKASMIFSDPIYNINVDYDKGIGGKANYDGKVLDSRTDEEYQDLIEKSIGSALSVSKKDLHVFYWSDSSYIWLIQMAYRKLGIQNRRVCLWIKNGFNVTPQICFNKTYEPCTYGTLGKPYLNNSLQNLSEVMNPELGNGNSLVEDITKNIDIWAEKRIPGSSYMHATQKPCQLAERAIRRCTKPNDIILDSFAGSGSTLIAGEQLKRRVYCVELEPVFCDLIIARFEKLTGIKARIIN